MQETASEVKGPAPASVLPRVDGYEIVEELGRGGMGVVYKARQASLGRTVALKMLRAWRSESAQEVERFHREARAAARLSHPNIVSVYETGQANGLPYFTMPVMTGGSLKDISPQLLSNPRAAVALVEKVARAVHHAHENGVFHRDLKPSNILLDAHGEPLVSDFGLAKLLDSDIDLTQSGQIFGTPPYMAPEQVVGATRQVGRGADVWALGVVLYELLTGRRPFPGNERDEIFKLIQAARPTRLTQLRPELPLALEKIIRKCLARSPARRYQTMALLADALAALHGKLPDQLSGSSLETVSRLRTTDPVAPAPFRRLTQRFGRWALGAMILLAAAGLALWLGSRRLPPPEDPPARPRFAPGVWSELLEQRPREVQGPEADTDAWWKHDPEKHELWVNTENVSFFQLAEVDAAAFDLEITFSQNPLIGGVGLIFQGRDDPPEPNPKPWSEFLLLRRFDVLAQDKPAELERGVLWRRADNNRLFLDRLRVEKIDRPQQRGRPHSLGITVGPDGLTKVVLEEKEIAGRLFAPRPETPPKVGAKGVVGVMTQTSSVTILSARLRVHPVP
jgi:serine/threonine protein kinase